MEHRNKQLKGFTKKYNVYKLVYFEGYSDIEEAIKREYLIKRWRRTWKFQLISSINPELNDLFSEIPALTAGKR